MVNRHRAHLPDSVSYGPPLPPASKAAYPCIVAALTWPGSRPGSAGLDVYVDQHCAAYSVGLFVGELRGRGLGREVTEHA
jgi:hypothetical protein